MDKQAIREIQEWLRLLATYDPRLIPLTADGIYSTQTAEAVRIFQQLYGLQPTGDVDNATWQELRDTADELARTTNLLAVFPHPQYILRPNETAPIVTVIQWILQELSNSYDNINSVTISGIYDSPTVREIERIQKLHRLEPNGIVDLKTWNILTTLFHNRTLPSRR